MKNRISAAACALAVLLLVPDAFGQESQSLYDVDATTSSVRIEVDLSGQLQVSGINAEHVRVESASHTAGGSPDCPISIQQNGGTVEIEMQGSDACNRDMDLQVFVPRRFSATILAPETPEVVVRDLDGRVTGEVSPELECHFRSFRGSSSCAGGQFDLNFSMGEFAMRAQNEK